jgi:hypothetical protein
MRSHGPSRRAVRVAWKRKGGNASVLELGAELRNEITNGAMRESESTSDLGHGLTLHKKGSHDLVTAMLRSLRVEEELAIAMVIHDQSSKVSSNYFEKPGRNGIPNLEA